MCTTCQHARHTQKSLTAGRLSWVVAPAVLEFIAGPVRHTAFTPAPSCQRAKVCSPGIVASMRRVLFGNSNWTSPYVLSCFVSLREKGLPFDVKDVALHSREHHAPEFAKQTLTSRVPVLLEDGLALSESSAIVEYLEDAYPAPTHPRILPMELRARARARQVMAWLRSDLLPLREQRSAEYVFYPHSELTALAELSPQGLKAANKLLVAAEQLIAEHAGPLLGAWCIADTDLAMMLQRLIKTGFKLPRHVTAYAEGQWQRASVMEFCAHKRPPYQRAVTLV